MDSTELDRVARDLKAARNQALNVFALCSGYVDVRAAEGDPRAVELAGMVASAHDQLVIANIDATTAFREATA
jgi:hypothetical protein